MSARVARPKHPVGAANLAAVGAGVLSHSAIPWYFSQQTREQKGSESNTARVAYVYVFGGFLRLPH